MAKYDAYPITFKRIALNMDQVTAYNPPPFAAKLTSARYQGYIDEHGTNEAWELDALEPSVLRDLIREHVEEHFDEGIHELNNEEIEDKRARLRAKMADPAWAAGVLGTE